MSDKVTDRRKNAFFLIDNAIIDDFGSVVGAVALAVYSVIVRHADRNGEKAFPSLMTIGNLLDISKPTVSRAIEKLVMAGLISKEARYTKDGSQTSNLYAILDPPTPPIDGRANTSGQRLPTGGEGKDSLPSPVKNFAPPCKNSLPDQDTLIKTNFPSGSSEVSPTAQPSAPANVNETDYLTAWAGKVGIIGNYGRTRLVVRKLIKHGCSVEEMCAIYDWLKIRDNWYADRAISIETIVNHLTVWRELKANPPAQALGGATLDRFTSTAHYYEWAKVYDPNLSMLKAGVVIGQKGKEILFKGDQSNVKAKASDNHRPISLAEAMRTAGHANCLPSGV